MTILCCPRCGNDEVSSNDVIPGLALGVWAQDKETGAPTFDGYGETNVYWDGQQPVDGCEAYCRSCDWSGPSSTLEPAPSTPDGGVS
jgi:hypothetical protein